MNGVRAIFERELRSYFFSPMAWIVLAFVLLVNGYVFALILSFLSDARSPGSVTPMRLFFGDTFFFWMLLIFIVPVLTMRLISEERKSGTLEMLMTAPVNETQVVLGKYFAALAFYVFLWLPTGVYVLVVAQHSSVDWGPIASGYLGIFGIGSVFLAVGLLASSLSKNQIVAAVITFAMLMFFFAIYFIDNLVTDETIKNVLTYMNLLQHMEDFGKGIVDTRRLVYYLSTSVLFLFFTSRTLAAKKWS